MKLLNYKKEIINNGTYALIRYVALGLRFFRDMIIARVLGPEQYGVLDGFLIITTYTLYANLGIVQSMNREYMLEKEEEKSKVVLSTVFGFLMLICAILMLVGFFIAFLYTAERGLQFLLSIICVFILGAFNQLKAYYKNVFVLQQDFPKINALEVIEYIVSFVLIVIFWGKIKVLSILVFMLIAVGACLVFSVIKTVQNISIKIESKMLKKLIVAGIPLLLNDLSFYFFLTIDKLMIVQLLGSKELGYYAFASQMVTATIVFIDSILSVNYPRFLKMLNCVNIDRNDAMAIIIKYSEVLQVCFLVFFLIGYIIINPFICMLMPGYMKSISVYGILVMAVLVRKAEYFVKTYIISNNNQLSLVKIQIILIIFAVIFNVLFINMGLEIEGVAMATLLTSYIGFVLHFYVFAKMIEIDTRRKFLFDTAKKLFVFILILIIIYVIELNLLVSFFILCIVFTFLYGGRIKGVINEFIKN